MSAVCAARWWTAARRPAHAARGGVLALSLVLGYAARAAVNTDSGLSADRLAPIVAAGPREWWEGAWVRLRDMSDLPAAFAADPRRAGLAALREQGVRSLIYYTPSGALWRHGERVTNGRRSYPLDLGEAYLHAERLAFNTWPDVAAWEIGGEPDLFWNNELAATYVAYFKAVALGLRAGTEAAARADRSALSEARARPAAPREPLILNGALAMTPGPYLEQFTANDAFSYIDGFNWHFYGYPEDFTAQYGQFENAVTTLTAARSRATGSADRRGLTKSLPVFLTEYGYAGMDGPAAATVAGRVRQWRFFHNVTTQMQALRIAGPLAFYLPPYLEGGRMEFGLAMKPAGLKFSPADFGLTQKAPWMGRIGAPVGHEVASPALAWLAAQPAPSRTHDWRVTVAPPSPVVIDFVPTDELDVMKSWHGYLMKPGAGTEREGGGELRIYNFSEQTLTGRLTAVAPAELETRFIAPEGGRLTLAPFGLTGLPVRLRLTADELRAFAWEIKFTEEKGRVPTAVFATKIFPNAATMRKETLFRFDHPPEVAAKNRELLVARPLAAEEPRLHAQGRWLVSDDLMVEETADGWRFRLATPAAPTMRCGMAELPLPDGFEFPAGQLLGFEHRLAATSPGAPEAEFDCLFRSTNGNLFEVMPRFAATAAWQPYLQAKENFTGMSYGRMTQPWRFAETRPAALVFFFRPKATPATFELRNVELTRYRVK